ncbi:MAG: pilus assembly protein [Massilia sp.]|nr:pilus assembly protein [Massilia sp.]
MSPRARRCDGAVLLTALFVLVAILAIGVSAAQIALSAEKSARNERDRHIAFQAAEAGLADAERDIEGGADPGSARAMLFEGGSVVGFVDGCGRDSANLGLCAHLPGAAAPAWKVAELSAPDGAGSPATPYGKFTGETLPTGGGALPARPPRYLIELLPLVRAGEDAGQRSDGLYRITAIGFGALPGTQVVLQSFYRKAAPAQGSLQ